MEALMERAIKVRDSGQTETAEELLEELVQAALCFVSAHARWKAGDEAEAGNMWLWLGALAGLTTVAHTRSRSL